VVARPSYFGRPSARLFFFFSFKLVESLFSRTLLPAEGPPTPSAVVAAAGGYRGRLSSPLSPPTVEPAALQAAERRLRDYFPGLDVAWIVRKEPRIALEDLTAVVRRLVAVRSELGRLVQLDPGLTAPGFSA